MNIVDQNQLPTPRGATAHLVAWIDIRTGRIVDAGIYSEENPTCMDLRRQRTRCLLSSMSRFDSNQGGFGRAQQLLRRAIAQTPSLRWVYGMRTFALGEVRRRQLDAQCGVGLYARAA